MVVVSIIMAEENTLSILNTINIIIVVVGIMAEGTTVGEVTLTTVFIRVTVDTDTASDQVLAGFIRGIMLIHLSL
jgi:hypothetical protein